MAKWASTVGLLLTAIGVLVAFYLPRLGVYYGSSLAVEQKESRLRARITTGAALVIIGTLLQVYGVWS
jgi:hypothetical protein